jgi:hypothetical protein
MNFTNADALTGYNTTSIEDGTEAVIDDLQRTVVLRKNSQKLVDNTVVFRAFPLGRWEMKVVLDDNQISILRRQGIRV